MSMAFVFLIKCNSLTDAYNSPLGVAAKYISDSLPQNAIMLAPIDITCKFATNKQRNKSDDPEFEIKEKTQK